MSMRKVSAPTSPTTSGSDLRPRSASYSGKKTTSTYKNAMPRGPLALSIDPNASFSPIRIPDMINTNVARDCNISRERQSKRCKNLIAINVKKCTQWEAERLCTIPGTYKTTGPKRGLCLIINNMVFTNEKPRAGAECDEENLEELMKQFKIQTVILRNLKAEEMKKAFRKFSENPELKQIDLCFVIVMSHGTGDLENTFMCGTDGIKINVIDIANYFNAQNCKFMAHKPKMFVFQNCRGGTEMPRAEIDAVDGSLPLGTDMLLAFSTFPKCVSYRDPDDGSFYIKTLCKVFMKHAHNKHVAELFALITKELKELSKNSEYRQVSTEQTYGFEMCYLNPV